MLTHGHEDHLGGVPYLLRERADLPVVGSRFTLALLEAKLREHRIRPVLREVREEEQLQLGPFALEFFAVNHSIPDALAVAIRTPPGWCCTPATSRWTSCRSTGGSPTSAGSPGSGAEGVDLLLSRLHQRRGPRLRHARARDRAGRRRRRAHLRPAASSSPASPATCTASSRCSTPPSGTAGTSRSSAGRWCATWASPATSACCTCRPGLMIDMKDVERCPTSASCWCRPGSQGEPLSALSRMANRSHHQIRIEAQDTVVLASSLIPGNENAVYRVINGLSRWGARVVHKGVAKVHVSGHAPAGELLYLLNATQPSQPHAGARRVAAPARARRARPAHRRARGADRARRGRRRGRPRRRQGLDRRRGPVRLRVRRRPRGRRRHRDDPQGPSDPRRGGLHLGHRRPRRRHRQAVRRPADRGPRLLRRPARLRPGARAHRGRARRRRRSRASATCTPSRRPSGGSSGAGSTTPTGAGR